MDYIVLGSNFALLVKSPGDDGQQLLTTGSRLGMYIIGRELALLSRCVLVVIFTTRKWSFAKVMFLHLSVILFTLGWYPSTPCSRSPGGGGVVSKHALQVSRPTPRGEGEGDLAGGAPGPHPRRKLRGICLGGLQAHTQGVSPGPQLEGLQAHTWGASIPACTEADPPTTTAAAGMHPTGMHSCLIWEPKQILSELSEVSFLTTLKSALNFYNPDSGIHSEGFRFCWRILLWQQRHLCATCKWWW